MGVGVAVKSESRAMSGGGVDGPRDVEGPSLLIETSDTLLDDLPEIGGELRTFEVDLIEPPLLFGLYGESETSWRRAEDPDDCSALATVSELLRPSALAEYLRGVPENGGGRGRESSSEEQSLSLREICPILSVT